MHPLSLKKKDFFERRGSKKHVFLKHSHSNKGDLRFTHGVCSDFRKRRGLRGYHLLWRVVPNNLDPLLSPEQRPNPCSLTTTNGVSVDFFSSSY